MIISELILLLEDELKIEGDIPVCFCVKTNHGVIDVDITGSTARFINSPNKYILLLRE